MDFAITGAGIINNSGIIQNFVILAIDYNGFAHTNILSFTNSATAGSLTQFSVYGGTYGEQFDGGLAFFDNSTAGSSTILIFGASDIWGGGVYFYGSSSAENAAITVNEHQTNGTGGGLVFNDTSSAGDATITCNPSSAISFDDTAGAANATLIIDGGSGGDIAVGSFRGNSTGGTASAKVVGNGSLRIRDHVSPGMAIGSLEGDGSVLLGANNLTVGTNNLSTIFSGVIQDDNLGGSLSKVGTGRLTLSGANTYTGGTILSSGILLANNATGSATGTGPVQVTAGTLGGGGIIAGTVIVGTGSGSGAILGPGPSGIIPGTLSIQKKLILMSDASYKVTLNSNTPAADKVSARSVRIRRALILFDDRGSSLLSPGTVFTVIENTGATPISGTFANLADGSTVVVGSNTFQADYEGGDGNDLTLTVVP